MTPTLDNELELGVEPLHWRLVAGQWFICVMPECDGDHHVYCSCEH
jgi:hypothetical protein